MNVFQYRFNGGTLIVTNIRDDDATFMQTIEKYIDLLNQYKVYGTVEVTLENLRRRLNSKLTSIA
jgi:uncharacterized protein (DUF2267 family)